MLSRGWRSRQAAITCRRRDAEAASDEQVAAMHEQFMQIVSAEDYRLAEQAWANCRHAPGGTRWTLGRSESLLQRYHRDIDRVLEGYTV